MELYFCFRDSILCKYCSTLIKKNTELGIWRNEYKYIFNGWMCFSLKYTKYSGKWLNRTIIKNNIYNYLYKCMNMQCIQRITKSFVVISLKRYLSKRNNEYGTKFGNVLGIQMHQKSCWWVLTCFNSMNSGKKLALFPYIARIVGLCSWCNLHVYALKLNLIQIE